MKKKEKGQPGYIKWRKEKYLIGTIAEFAVVIALVVLGYVQTKTKLNLLTVVAVVGCLPGIKDAGRIYYHCTTSEYRKRYLSGNRGESVTFKKMFMILSLQVRRK